MNFDDYQQLAQQTAVYPGTGTFDGLVYATLGLSGEAGEVVEKVKKLIRDYGCEINGEREEAIVKELGDVLWYVAMICRELSVPMSYVADVNIDKLRQRSANKTLRGDGDDR